MKKAIALLFFCILISSCTVLKDRGIVVAPTPDIEKTIYWAVDDAVMAASTQLVYEMRKEINTLIPPTATPTSTYMVPV